MRFILECRWECATCVSETSALAESNFWKKKSSPASSKSYSRTVSAIENLRDDDTENIQCCCAVSKTSRLGVSVTLSSAR